MTATAKYSVRVQSAQAGPGQDLFSLLETVSPVSFHFGAQNGTPAAGEIMVAGIIGDQTTPHRSIPALIVCEKQQVGTGNPLQEIEVQFADTAEVPFPFRGRTLKGNIGGEVQPLKLHANEKVLATVQSQPVWTVSGNGLQFRSGFSLPEVPPDKGLRDVLNGDRFFEILPLLHFLRKITGEDAYAGLPLRACFIVDDPNLHWPSYGFVRFQQIAERAARENFHVAFATIPLDAWYAHRETVEIFRRHPRQISLLIHGNNHTHKELAQEYAPADRIRLLSQAVARSQRLERKTGLRIARVMAPPHGACSAEMLHDLPQCGFEAATISHGSLRSFNKGKPWTRNVGYLPNEWIGGCPVLPRWGFNGNITSTVMLAAYLKQPLLLMGHHQDFSDGLEVLDRLGRLINSLGPVQWSDLTELNRAGGSWRLDQGTLRLRPFSRKLSVSIPKGATTLEIEQPFTGAGSYWSVAVNGNPALAVHAGEPVSLPDGPGGNVEIEAAVEKIVPKRDSMRSVPPWAVVRRLLTEGRDRLARKP